MLRPYLVMMDTHRPYHNRRAYKLQLKIAKDIRIRGLYIIGDYADFYYVNGHGAKHPGIKNDLMAEIEDVNAGLNELDKMFPRIPKVYIEGNHEHRLERFLHDKAPELYGLFDVRSLFKMHERVNWKWIPYGPSQKTRVGKSKLWARHEPPPGPLPTAAKTVGGNLIFGHVHRMFQGHHVTMAGEDHVALCGGWMGDKRKDEVFGYVKGHHLWQLGFTLVWVDDATGYFFAQNVHIQDNYTAMVNGKLYRG
jgi:hypothetical protein